MRIRWRGLELPNRLVCDKETQTESYGKFTVEPFERGFGTTIGNSLRRILLSSLEGTAPVSMRIKGVSHEFESPKGILEDVPHIVQAVKKLQVALTTDAPKVLTLKANKKGAVTAADFNADADAEIMNPELVLCHLTAQQPFELEVAVRRGRGYQTAEELSQGSSELGLIWLDANFSPITRVRFKTEYTRVGKLTNYDRLILEIWTDGTKDPEFCLVEAAKIMRKHLNPFVQYYELKDQLLAEGAKVGDAGRRSDEVDRLRQLLLRPITELDLNVRANNCMRAERIHTIADLVARSEDDLLEIRNLGKTTLKEIKKKIEDMGLRFGVNLADYGIGAEAGMAGVGSGQM
ncbi:MAG: DNA-directed RNA polymerase subunit alpha [Planctomycetes bacterium]|nr:DNA-directed RNA polymerase subunit alpha [Planctomycetota bacterium]MCW8136465.1 DNA-directed RNA polymerase subunit alpha [Planctomycetota bacterium]